MITFDPGKIRVIGFDADDTLWVNEPYYRETEERFCEILKDYSAPEETNRQLYSVEMANMELYGYGTKAFILSLIETAILISGGKIEAVAIDRIIQLGKKQIAARNSILPGVQEVLEKLAGHYRLIVATKGDLLDQERKLRNSGISGFFHHIEIMTDKKEENYSKLLRHLDIDASEFLMIGNSVRSDVLPVVSLGGHAIHVPFHITWQHESAEGLVIPEGLYATVESIEKIPALLDLD
jgi:putative hydrolase of the HAD superfamily